MPRARLQTCAGRTIEWHSKALRAYQRRTLTADALIAGAYLAGTNTRRVRRALAALFRGAVSKDIVSRVWRKIKSDWDAWNARSLAAEPIVRLILDGTVVRVRLDRKATSISLLVVIGVREDGQKVKGEHSVGVARQYCGQLGKQDNCQVAVSLSLAACRTHEMNGQILKQMESTSAFFSNEIPPC